VDTTSSPFGWNLYHIAVNQDVQMKLYDELSSAIESEGGEIHEQFLKPSTCPYLHAVIRESHRLTPAAPITLSKENSLADVQIHDTVIPKGSLVSFENYSLGMDPNIIDNPTHFQPERWLPPAIEARKGTPAETIDHPFFKAPFSHGSRKCPGSRVANNEILILISQLVLDWKISAPSNINSYDDMEYTMTGMVTPNLPKLEFQARM
jgi:cytochrome P450